jgi:aminobenzoyl-glutamate utilization protein B
MLRSVRVVVFVAAAWTMRAGAGAAPLGRTSQAEPASAARQAQPASAARERLQRAVLTDVEGRQTLTQQMVDSIFSFGELGFQEVETSRYLVALLKREGFTVEEGVAGIPTAWVATWGSGKPVIALGSDIDGIPQASQKPGVAYHEPLIPGAPGHGEGHNSGQAVNITAALAVKTVMEREHQPGTLKIWPGVAEEVDGSKPYFVRAGMFKDVDACLFSHVASTLATSWGAPAGTGSIDVIYNFQGESAHAAAAPWRGKSALDAVELMDVGWNFRREHLRLQQRSHYVIPDGGDQPNVVPSTASVWYYFRELDYPHIKELWELGTKMAQAAAMMTGATLTGMVVTGEAYPQHSNRPIAEAMYANIERVGLPQWSAADQKLATALQRELKVPEVGLAAKLPPLGLPVPEERNMGGGSDDIGSIMFTVPTVTLRYPANFEAGPGHSWANGVAMATPIAHKGSTAGAKVQALTLLDLLTQPELVSAAWTYFRTEQTKSASYPYRPLIRPEDKPATWLNRQIMEQYRAAMRPYYYDPTKYKTYLDQLGITYPTTR